MKCQEWFYLNSTNEENIEYVLDKTKNLKYNADVASFGLGRRHDSSTNSSSDQYSRLQACNRTKHDIEFPGIWRSMKSWHSKIVDIKTKIPNNGCWNSCKLKSSAGVTNDSLKSKLPTTHGSISAILWAYSIYIYTIFRIAFPMLFYQITFVNMNRYKLWR